MGESKEYRVTLTKGFWMGKTEVTQGQWKSVMGKKPSRFTGAAAARPVDSVSWNDCQKFIEKANARLSGIRLRLPTEAEWEYACRAGTAGGGTLKPNEIGWHFVNSGGKVQPVGRKKPNDWGLCDMHGNVWEMCADWYGAYPSGDATDPTGPASGSLRVLRGGDYDDFALHCRSAYRYHINPSYRHYDYGVGFRLCCSAGLSDSGTE